MKKAKIYLDTSVISHLKADDTPEKMIDTLLFWDELKQNKFEVIISRVTLEELAECPEPKQSILFDYLGQIEYTIVDEVEESFNLAKEYIKYGVLNQKSYDDCRHIAVATMNECKFIISWNFKHIVNYRTIEKVKAVNKLLGFNEFDILPPSMILKGDE